MTAYRDVMFPVSPPAFLFSRNVTILRTSLLDNDSTDDGWPVEGTAAEVAVKAHVAQPDPRSLDPSGEAIDAVILLANGTEVSHRDKVRVETDPTLPPQLVGTFRISDVRPNVSHTRILATRITDPQGAER